MKRSIFAAIAGFIAIISVQSFAMRRQTIKRIGKPVVKNFSRRLFSTSKRKVQVPRTPKEFKQIRSRQYSTKQKEESPWAHLIKNSLETTEKPPKRAWWPWKKKPTLSSSLPKRYGGVPGPSLWQQIKSNKWVRRITGMFGLGAGVYGYTRLVPGNIQDLIQADNILQFLTHKHSRNEFIRIAKKKRNQVKAGELLLQNYETILNAPPPIENAAEIFEMFLSKVVPKMDAENKENFIKNLLSKINKQSNFRLLNNNKFATGITLAMEGKLTNKQQEKFSQIIKNNKKSILIGDGKLSILLGILQYAHENSNKSLNGLRELTQENLSNIIKKKNTTEAHTFINQIQDIVYQNNEHLFRQTLTNLLIKDKKSLKELTRTKEGLQATIKNVLTANDSIQAANIVANATNTPGLIKNPEIVLAFCNLHQKIQTNIKKQVDSLKDLSTPEKKRRHKKLHDEREPLSKTIEAMNVKAIKGLSSMKIEDFLSWSQPKQKALVKYIKLNFEDEGLTAKEHLFNKISDETSKSAGDFAQNSKILQLIVDNIEKNDLIRLRDSFVTHIDKIDKDEDNRKKISKTIFPIIDKKLKEMGVRLN